MKGIMWFSKKGKLSPIYVRLFEIPERIGLVAYRLALQPSITGVHEVYHVPILRKYIRDPSHVLRHQELEIMPGVKYEVQPEKGFRSLRERTM